MLEHDGQHFRRAKMEINRSGVEEDAFLGDIDRAATDVGNRSGQTGNAEQTFQKWSEYVGCVVASGISAAIAVQDGMTVESVKSLSIQPDVICVGGTTEWKWETVESWANSFKRVHLLRCNMPDKLDYLQSLGVESCDGTGWNRGDRRQTEGLERWAKMNANPVDHDIFPFVSRATCKHQITFA